MVSREWATALSGGLSGLSQVCAEQPFDTIKTRLQSRRFDLSHGPVVIVRNTYAREGLRAFFQGLTPRLLTYSAVKFSLFSLYEHFRSIVGSSFVAGGMAGALNAAVSCPQDLLKSQLQMQIASGADAYRGPMVTIRSLVHEHGVAVFWRGYRTLFVRDTLGYAILYSTFANLKQARFDERRLPTWACGGISGLCFYLSTLPIDRVKTIMMTQDFSRSAARNGRVLNPMGAFMGVYESQGMLGFYRGCSPTLLRTFFGQAVALSIYDAASQALTKEAGEL
mmetsp:Transcript_39338/g.106240  ORF Transcript_39338/g.106240 Transcript_39338/m.106240 type:complete len:280 (+) Transcript_39338:250-1089(+)|eukprot:CAMPEP_0119522554 /NCGR_PEP_ID=MMETSP1344-20130328/37863_1 /TAXON_ID=236787 /ORGANISM="Florenciella parvula, Strain CCMP2471" /LENGTH=279 /DNA_ID=CAMNT_0007560599 /DNA_START=246 /DNA_END=1085 /DNA_ORIENTATION=-